MTNPTDSTARRRRSRTDAPPADLVEAARLASQRAYAPYSGFKVGCVLRDASGGIHLGANVENASYPLGICAERTALLAWRSSGAPPVVEAVIYTPTRTPTPPCGLCRDALRRWAPGARVYSVGLRSVGGSHRTEELLPDPSGRDSG